MLPQVLTRGDSQTYKFRIQDENTEEPVTQTPDSLVFTMRKTPKCPIVLQKKLSAGEIILSPEDYYYRFTLLPEDTATLEAGEYGYDVEARWGDVVKSMTGTIVLGNDYTHPEDR